MSPRPIKSKDNPPELRCQECGKMFRANQYYQRWCSATCRMTAYWRRRLARGVLK